MTMETSAYRPSVAADQTIAGAIAAFVNNRLDALRRYHKYLRTVRALNACTDRVLEDNGMYRADIRAIARRDSMGIN